MFAWQVRDWPDSPVRGFEFEAAYTSNLTQEEWTRKVADTMSLYKMNFAFYVRTPHPPHTHLSFFSLFMYLLF